MAESRKKQTKPKQSNRLRAYESANQMNLPTVAGMIAAILLGVATENADAGIAGVSAIQAGNIQRQLNFTRANEKEADRIGIQTLARICTYTVLYVHRKK